MLPTFEQVLAEAPQKKSRSVLLGNWFSRACKDDIFNYATLFKQADFGPREESIRRVFEELETYDFEQVMRVPESPRPVLEGLGASSELQQEVIDNGELLKNVLITAIVRTHPNRPYEIDDAAYVSTRKFLVLFGQIFSVAPDLLLYWARNKIKLEPVGHIGIDGFIKGEIWDGTGKGADQNVYLLHGGLHLHEDDLFIRKHVYYQDGPTIVDQVRENLEKGQFPILVSEPTAEKKRKRIVSHPYLSFCFSALGRLSGSLFVIGHAFGEHDRHLFDQALKSGNLRRVFVSLHGDENSPANQQTKANARTFLGDLGDDDVQFFDAASLPIWGRADG
jgi:hypothetical protein